MSTSEASASSLGSSGLEGSSAGQPSQALPRAPASRVRREQPEGGPMPTRKLPHCRDCRRPMKGHHKHTDCPRVRATARRLRDLARFHSKLKKLRAKVEVVEGPYEDIQDLAREAEDLRYKTCVVKRGKSAGHDAAWLVIGENGKAVQNMGSELRKNLKTKRWGGPEASKMVWKVLSSSTVQDVIRTWLQSWFSGGKERQSCN